VTRRSALLVLGLALAATGVFVLGRETDDSIGATNDLVENARWPLRWESNETVTFATWTGTTTVRLDGTIVSSAQGTPSTGGPAGTDVEPDARFGSWRAWDGGRYLVRGDERCVALLPSPDGRFLACVHTTTDRMHETSEAYGAAVRVR
jgi:hypothetical protein